MSNRTRTLECAAALQAIAAEISATESKSESAAAHSRLLFGIAADLLVEATGLHARRGELCRPA